MKKQRKFFVQILFFLIIILLSCNVYASDLASNLEIVDVSEDYRNYLELSDEEKKNTMEPRKYDIPKTQSNITNPLRFTRRLRALAETKYSLKDIIPENMIIKNQEKTGSCWTFASLGALESNLALMDYKNGKSVTVYDYSERHMEYATSKTFKDGINEAGFNREVGSGGAFSIARAYLTNGTGAISEKEMEFENNENKIDISNIQNKTVITQVNDIIEYPSYKTTDDTTQIKQQIKEQIKNYGGVYASIHGAQLSETECYNNKTGAIYCDNSTSFKRNHAILIVGWDDDYSKENFMEGRRPKNNGAWIIKNSWGTEFRVTLVEMKEYIYNNFENEREKQGWTNATQISDEYAIKVYTNSGYTVKDGVGVKNIGDNGFMYVSYEDVFVYTNLSGIMDAKNEVTYENIYQYDYYGQNLEVQNTATTTYLATVFDKKTTKTEYLTQVSISAPETYTCKIYVNPNGTGKTINDLQQVQLKTGETETFNAGYHTIEFQEPIKITGKNFVVVLEIQGQRTGKLKVAGEYNEKEFDSRNASSKYDNVTVENGKCYLSNNEAFEKNQWIDTSRCYSAYNGLVPNFDTTIKAFTTSKIFEGIEITKEPTKKIYIEGQDFDATGMVVKAKYTDGSAQEIKDYLISNGTNLGLGQTTVTISYNGKIVTQNIKVEENTIQSISIKNIPDKTIYWAGEDFDAKGMVVEGIYKDETKQILTDYVIKDGKRLKNSQTTVTIEYNEKTVIQAITVQMNTVENVEIKQEPNKVKYIVGQNFNSAGMKIEAKYKNGTVKQVENYSIKNGTNLQLKQTSVTIEYEEKTVEQPITVVNKTVTEIKVKAMPAKTEYIQNKEELDLTNGVIEIFYDDDSKEEMAMTSEELKTDGFNNKIVGTNTITIIYKEKKVQFNVKIKEEKKPQNSNFDAIQGKVTGIREYDFTSTTKKEYNIISIDISNIVLATENDSMEYYYYLSLNSKETNISEWVKIEKLDNNNGKLLFEINTKDISNYEEVSSANNLYLYIKEVAILNDKKQEKITLAMELDGKSLKIEKYVDNIKKEEINYDEIIKISPDLGISLNSINGQEIDKTQAPEVIPKAGKRDAIIGLLLILIIIKIIVYLRYKNIKIK